MTLAPAAAGASRLRTQFETPLFAMVVAVGLVLLVACANIASLLLARALARRGELSVRLALGGSRWRLARLLFVESLLVAMTGAALGLVFAKWSSALLVQQLGTWESTISLDLALDWRVLVFTATLACLCAISAGVAPMIAMKSVAPGEALKGAGRAMAGDRRFAVRGALVVAQIAVSFVLVIAAGLFLRTFASLSQLPLGFVPEPLVVVHVNLLASGIPPEERGARVERLRDAAAATPGVRSASVSAIRLLTGGGWFTNNQVAVGDGPMLPEDNRKRVWRNAITPGWFETMGIPLRSGRDFNDRDRVGSPLVAIVNEAFARRYLPGQQPIGQTLRVDSDDGPRYEIVGVVADAVYTTPRDGMLPTMYVPLAQREPREWNSWRDAVLTIKAVSGQRALVERDVADGADAGRSDARVHVRDVRSDGRRNGDAGTAHCDDVRVLRCARAPAGRTRALRHRGAGGERAPDGDRAAHGARRAADGHRAPCLPSRWRLHRGGTGRRPGWQLVGRTVHRAPALPGGGT